MVFDCFRINDKPTLPVTVIDPYNGNLVEVRPLIDTGFSGYLLIPLACSTNNTISLLDNDGLFQYHLVLLVAEHVVKHPLLK